jgi:hypothetical protein
MKHKLTLNEAIRITNAIQKLDAPDIAAALKPSNRAVFRLAKNKARLEAILTVARETYRAAELKQLDKAKAEGRETLSADEAAGLQRLNLDLGNDSEEVDLIEIPLSEFTGPGGAGGLIGALADLEKVIVDAEAA